MKISIVTVSFNQREFLKDAMDSLLDQGYPQLEYIIVDPGSTDGSRELIKSYSSRISCAVFEKDNGAAEGLNRGFSYATGEICGFLNSDDMLLPNSLQRIADFFEQHPECDIAIGNGNIVDGEGKLLKHVKARGFTVRRYFYGGTRWLQQSTFFRRERFLRSSRFNEANRTCWDGELFVNLVNEGATVGYIGSDLSIFRIHGGSISGSGRLESAYRKDIRRIFRKLRGREWGFLDEIWCFLYRSEGLVFRLRYLIGDLFARYAG
jgi:glycosyltransferase involved in cell wall biosynthesis